MTDVLLYGLQRSGTNFLEQLMLRNFDVTFLNSDDDRTAPIQKHFRLYDDKNLIVPRDYRNTYTFDTFAAFEAVLPRPADCYIVISKDPYSWTLSYAAWARKCNWRQVGFPFAAEWELFYAKWSEFARQSRKVIFVNYMDLLTDSARVLADLEEQTGMSRKHSDQGTTATLGRVPQSAKFTDAKKQYYIQGEYMSELSPAQIDAINEVVTDRTLQELGYKRERYAPA